jgi:molybdopterin synthase catalytic subunit
MVTLYEQARNMKNIFIENAIPATFIAESIAKHSAKKQIGAHSIFLGQVRNDVIDGEEVTGIVYTCYEQMVNEKMQEIREEIFASYALTCMHVYHSKGFVSVGEICLFVFTSSVHRQAAIDACTELVTRIKKQLPIWGKEITAQHQVWKKENH